MVRMAKRRARQGVVAALIAGLGVALSGCAYTMGELAQASRQPSETAGDKPVVLTDAVLTDDAVPVKPVALVEEADRNVAERPSVVATTGNSYPNINAAPASSKSKLLTPEEKAKVIAELEALARNQGASTVRVRQAAKAECDAAKALDPELKLKREREGLKC